MIQPVPSCRRCSECANSSHHWIPNASFGDDSAGVTSRFEFICKHCPAVGNECPGCCGTGEGESDTTDLCTECDGDGVILAQASNLVETELELPAAITELAGRCEIGEVTFDNDDLSAALFFGETLFHRFVRLMEHYERMSGLFMPGDIRGPMMADAAKDMREALSDCIAKAQ